MTMIMGTIIRMSMAMRIDHGLNLTTHARRISKCLTSTSR